MVYRSIIKGTSKFSEALSMLLLGMAILVVSGCSDTQERHVDRLNEFSYAWHYRNLDSIQLYADSAFLLSGKYDEGKAEALNNLAFVAMAKMDYDKVKSFLEDLDNGIKFEKKDTLVGYVKKGTSGF